MKEIKQSAEIELKNEIWSASKELGEEHYRQNRQQGQSLPMGKGLVGQVVGTRWRQAL